MHPIPSLLLIAALLANALLPGRAQLAAYPPRSAQGAEPQAEAIAERPRIRLAVEMAETKEGKTVTVSWLVEGWDSLAEQSDLELVLALPKALIPLEAEYLQPGEAPGTWRLALKEAAGRLDCRLSADAQLPLEIQASLWRKDELLDVYVALLEGQADLEKTTIVDARGGRVSGLEGRVSLDFTEGALAEAAGVQISAIEPQQNTRVLGSGQAFAVLAAGLDSQKAVRQFLKSFTIAVRYDPNTILGDEQSLSLAYFDETAQDWIPLPGWVDVDNHVLYGRSNHLSVFDVSIHTLDLARLPSLKSFETALFSGAAAYSFPLALPPGPGGLQPALALSYNSQLVDGAGESTQAGWVGMGWSLETGAIVRNMNGTSDYLGDDTYTLTLGGYSSQLVPGADGYYHSQAETFWRIKKNADDTWTVWDKTGSVYRFGGAYPSGSFTDLGYDMAVRYPNQDVSVLRYETYDWEACDNAGQTTWAWPLTRAQNPFQSDPNNAITYTYWYDVKNTRPDEGCDDQERHFAHAFYPQTIVYPNRRYRVHFFLENRADYRSTWNLVTSRTLFEKRRLDKIAIEHDANGDGTYEQTLRTYDLTYSDGAGNQVFPGIIWSQGGKATTLVSIQEKGLDGGALPATTFIYGDVMHLTGAANGYGGEITYTYDSVPYYAPAAGISNQIVDDFANQPNAVERWGGEIGLDGNNVRVCKGYKNEDGDYVCTGPGEAYRAYWSFLNNNHIRPGQAYVIHGSFSGSGVEVGLRGLNSSHGEVWRDVVTGSANFVLTPANTTEIEALVRCTSCTVSLVAVDKRLTRYRVTSKTLTDTVNSQSSVFQYQYTGAKTNAAGTYGANCPAYNTNTLGYKNCLNESATQFLGHSQVSETGPDGRKTVTQFYQDESGYKLLGKIKQVDVYDASNQLLTRATYTYGYTSDQPAESTDPNLFPHKEGGPLFSDLEITWPYLLSVKEQVFEPGNPALYTGVLRTYRYEKTLQGNAQYGNITGVVESRWNGSAWVDDRITTSAYYPAASASVYLVGLPGSENSYACPAGATNGTCTATASTNLSSTWYLYDNSATHAAPPTAGILTGKRIQTRLDGSVGYYQDIDYQSDAWGNRTVEKIYLTEGTTSVRASGAALSTATCYGQVGAGIAAGQWCAADGYHTYPAWQTNPAGQFTRWAYDPAVSAPILEVAANGEATRARYDQFGRLARLCRAGDESACLPGNEAETPTIAVTYLSNTPYRVELRQKIDEQGAVYRIQREYDGLGNLTLLRTLDARVGEATTDILVAYEYDGYGRQTGQTAPYRPGAARYFTHTEYDALGRPVEIVAPDGVEQQFIYSIGDDAEVGRVAKTTTRGPELEGSSGLLVQQVQMADAYGRVVKVEPPNGAGPRVIYAYDALGRLTGATYGSAQTTLAYDLAGRKTGMDDPSMGAWSYAYDAAGRLTRQGDARGQFTCLYYDALGRLSGKEYRADASCPTGLGGAAQVRYEYDGLAWEDAFVGPGLGASWLVSEPGQVSLAGGTVAIAGNASVPSIRLAHSLDDGQAIHFTFQVDSSGAAGGLQLESGTPGQSSYRRWAVEFSGGQLRYGYNQGATGASDALMALAADRWYEGELRSGGDGVVSLAAWERDNPAVMARRVLDLSPAAFGGLDWTFRAYATAGVLRLDSVEERVKTGTGQRTAMVDPSGSAAWTYDLRGQVTGEVKTIGAASYSTAWEYNAAGLPVSMTYPDGEVVEFDYHPQQLLDGMRSVTEDENYVSGTRYDEAGRVTWRGLGERLESVYAYHAWDGNPGSGGRLSTLQTWLETEPAGQSLVQGLAYAYHRDGNIQQIQDQPRAETLNFAYDILDRLDAVYLDGVLVDDPGYDSQGNLDFHGTSADPRDLVYAAPANHRATGLNGETYGYDANGNLTTRTAGGVTYTLSYDAENRLVSYAGGTVAAEFVYDGDGRRVMTVAGSGTTLHVGGHFEVFIPAETPEPTSTPTAVPTATETATQTSSPTATATGTGGSFPSTGLLDDFNRANGSVGANWSGDAGSYAIDGQKLKATASDKVIYWNGASYGADQEAYFALSTIDSSGEEMGLALKVSESGGTVDHAIEVFYSQSGQTVQVWTYASGGQGWVQRGSYPVTLANGDQLSAAASASGQVRVYRNGVLLTTVDVSGWPYNQGGGYIGVWMVNAGGARLDDFGGGTTAAPTHTPTVTLTRTPTPPPTVTQTPVPTTTATVTPTATPTATATGTGASFPSNSVLDDFNRANGGVGTSWSGDTGSYAIDGQTLKATASDKVIYWNGASYGANQEAYFALSTIDQDGVEMGLALKVSESGGVVSGAIDVFYSQSGQNVQVWTYASGGQGWVQRGSYPVVLSSGDQLGAAATSGGQVRVYRNGALLTTVDMSGWPYYQGGGYIGVWMVSAEDARLDDFGGGTLPTSLAPDRLRLAGLDLDGLKAGWERVTHGMRTWWARLWGGGTFASLDVAQGELRLRPARMRQILSPPAGEVWRKYYFAGSARIAVREVKDEDASDTLSFLLSDHLGSLSEVVTGASVSASQRYAAWGETRAAQGSPPTRFQFTGQYAEEDLGIYYFGARWFDPRLGRWLTPDSLIHDPANSLDWDRYAFSRNNSLYYTDPTGHWVETAFDVISLGMTINDIRNEGFTFWNTVSLVTDVASVALPIVPAGVSHAIRAAKYADAAITAAKTVDKVDNLADIVKHSDDVDIVYRVMRPDQHPAALVDGIIAKNPGANYKPQYHVSNGNHVDTNWISTTRDLEWAKRFRTSDNAIYAIDLRKVESEIFDATIPGAMNGWHWKPKVLAERASEVLVNRRIPANAIYAIAE